MRSDRISSSILMFLFNFIYISFQVHADSENYLSNELIRVEFGQRGITQLENLTTGKKFGLTRDEFSIVLNNSIIESESIKTVSVLQSENTLTYRYKQAVYDIEVIYELKPGWNFVSKQILVTTETRSDFKVDRIEVFKAELVQAPSDHYISRNRYPHLKTGDYGIFLRFNDASGLFGLVQNPFLSVNRKEKSFTIAYSPEMDWKSDYGLFTSDRGCLGIYQQTGERISTKLIPEWIWTGGVLPVTDEVQDWAEIDAYTQCVQAFIQPHPHKSVKINVGWCENDFQIDIATAAGREEYKRIIDRSAELGLEHVLFAPTNSVLGSREETADDWNWENLLWLGLGIKIRKGEWDPRFDPIPPSIQEMLDYARLKNIKLLAYIYPVMPFTGNGDWIVEGSSYHDRKRNASLGVRSFQDFLIDKLTTFYNRTGLGGYAFDYTYLWYDRPSRYAQWWGWRRIKETLRQRFPGIVIDGRQQDMRFGPWIWLAGSYPHPTSTDEQPESFNPFPDLHFDRVSANRQRYTAYQYRVNEYCPPELVPGFITHQTSRLDGDAIICPETGEMEDPGVLRLDTFRTRDWDYLGWKYSLFSSIATAGFNHVVNMIPARDPDEYRNFSDTDKKFFHDWLKWTDDNRRYLLKSKPIIGQPAIGRVDGTSAICEDRGYIFLFNPNARKIPAEFILDLSIGLEKAGRYILKELFPFENRLLGKPSMGVWSSGDRVSIMMDGCSALVLYLEPIQDSVNGPLLFNCTGKIVVRGKKLLINNIKGEIGSMVRSIVLLPDQSQIIKLVINGKAIPFERSDQVLIFNLRFSGIPFSHMQQMDRYEPAFRGGTISGSFKIPGRIVDQLAERKKSWPILWTPDDYKTSWLVPERLMLFIQIAEANENMNLSLRIDGIEIELLKAYTSVRSYPRCFVGFYADISNLNPEREYKYELSVPELKPGLYQGIFFENVETEYTDQLTE